MCLSKVYTKKNDSEILLLNSIERISVDGDDMIFTDLLGREIRIRGSLILADLVNGKVIIDAGDE